MMPFLFVYLFCFLMEILLEDVKCQQAWQGAYRPCRATRKQSVNLSKGNGILSHRRCPERWNSLTPISW